MIFSKVEKTLFIVSATALFGCGGNEDKIASKQALTQPSAPQYILVRQNDAQVQFANLDLRTAALIENLKNTQADPENLRLAWTDITQKQIFNSEPAQKGNPTAQQPGAPQFVKTAGEYERYYQNHNQPPTDNSMHWYRPYWGGSWYFPGWGAGYYNYSYFPTYWYNTSWYFYQPWTYWATSAWRYWGYNWCW